MIIIWLHFERWCGFNLASTSINEKGRWQKVLDLDSDEMLVKWLGLVEWRDVTGKSLKAEWQSVPPIIKWLIWTLKKCHGITLQRTIHVAHCQPCRLIPTPQVIITITMRKLRNCEETWMKHQTDWRCMAKTLLTGHVKERLINSTLQQFVVYLEVSKVWQCCIWILRICFSFTQRNLEWMFYYFKCLSDCDLNFIHVVG